jgi:putative membrane protein
VLAAVWYARGLHRWDNRSRPHHRWQTVSFYSGLLTLLLINESPLGALSLNHFSMHMVQHEILMMITLPLILLGAPTTPILRGLPRVIRRRVVVPLARTRTVRGGYRFLTNPIVAAAIFTIVMWSWHLMPGWYDRANTDALVHDLQHISFVFSMSLFWWVIIDPAPLHARMGYMGRMIFVLAVSTPKHFLASFITFADEPLYDTYETAYRVISISPKTDQEVAGLIMWAPSQMMMLLVMAVIFFVWSAKSDEQKRDESQAEGRSLALRIPR